MPFINAYEALHEEVSNSPELLEELKRGVANGEWPPSYMSHPVAIASEWTALPVAFYLDGVPYTNNDGLLGFWMYNLISSTRHLLGVLRKSKLCQCGCKGWCSFYPVMLFLHYNLFALATGLFPTDKCIVASDPLDEARLAVAGLEMSLLGALTMIKGDWAEYAHTIGFPTWADLVAPCINCKSLPENLYEDSSCGIMDSPWELTEQKDYDQACDLCEIDCHLESRADLEVVLAGLRYDKRASGARGRALNINIPRMGLVIGDRLEPSRTLTDISAFAEIQEFPCTVVFWRRSRETRTRHRNPLFDEAIGVTVSILVVDQLHALNLGVVKEFSMHILWELLICNAWRVDERIANEEGLQVACSVIKGELFNWYDARHSADPYEKLSRLQEFKRSMIGSRNARKLRSKAAETKGFYFFLCHLLRLRGNVLQRRDVWQAGADALERLLQNLGDFPVVLSIDQNQDPYPVYAAG